MDWRAEAIQKLRGYEANKCRLEAAARCPVSELDTSANPQTLADFTPPPSICTDGADPVALELEQARLWVAMVDSALEVLDPDGRLVLEALYIRQAKGNVARLQEVFSIVKSQVYARRDKALGAFTMALYGVDIAKGPPR